MGRDRRWMPLFIGDYLADTAHLTVEQSGAYLHLIMHYWLHNGLPSDDAELRQISRLSRYKWKNFCPILKSFFLPEWRHKRIDAELQRARATSEKRSRAGAVGAGKRWQKPSWNNGRATPHHISKTTTTENVPRARRKREPLEPSAELHETVKRKGWRQ